MSVADEIRKLAELHERGVIDTYEFNRQKRLLLEGVSTNPDATEPDWTSLSLVNKWWFQLITAIVIPPVGLILFATSKAHKKTRSGAIVRIGIDTKLIFGGLIVTACALAILRNDDIIDNFKPANPFAVHQSLAQRFCADPEVHALVREAVEQRYAYMWGDRYRELSNRLLPLYEQLAPVSVDQGREIQLRIANQRGIPDPESIVLCAVGADLRLLTVMINYRGEYHGSVYNYGMNFGGNAEFYYYP